MISYYHGDDQVDEIHELREENALIEVVLHVWELLLIAEDVSPGSDRGEVQDWVLLKE